MEPPPDTDLFDDEIVAEALGQPNLVDRAWLREAVESAIEDEGCRMVLLTGDIGSGKTIALAQLAARRGDSLRYFLRADSVRRSRRTGDVYSYLEAIGHQLAGRRPDLFEGDALRLTVEQTIGRADGSVTGITADEVYASPFRQTAITVRQRVGALAGPAVGAEIRRVVADPRALGDWNNLSQLALLMPAQALARTQPRARIVILIDALDEAQESNGTGILDWLVSAPPMPPSVRIVVSARPGGYLTTLRIRQRDQLREVVIDPTAQACRLDVAEYIRSSLMDPATAAVRSLVPDGGRHWAEAAAGNFQYASALLASTVAALRRNDQAAAERLARTESLPPDLRPLYSLLVSQIHDHVRQRSVALIDGGEGSAWTEVYLPLLAAFTLAREPLDTVTAMHLARARVRSDYAREAVADISHFLTTREGRHRLHHRSLAEFLVDPQTERESPACYVDPGEWEGVLVDASIAAMDAGPDSPAALYGLDHVVAHLQGLARRRPLGAAHVAALRTLTTDLATVERRVGRLGVDQVIADGRAAVVMLAGGEGHAEVEQWVRVLDRQAHRLRPAAAGEQVERLQAVFAQQVHLEAGLIAASSIAAAARARVMQLGRQPLVLELSAGEAGPELLRTIDVRATVRSLAACLDGRIVAGVDDGSVRIYETETGRLLDMVAVSSDPVCVVAMMPNDDAVVWGSRDGRVGRWNPATGERRELTVPSLVRSMAPKVDVRVQMAETMRASGFWLRGQSNSVSALSVRADRAVAVGTREGGILVVDPDFAAFAGGWPAHGGPVSGLLLRSDGALSCGHDGAVRLSGVTNERLLFAGDAGCVAGAPDGGGGMYVVRHDAGIVTVATDLTVKALTSRVETAATSIGLGPEHTIAVGRLSRPIALTDARTFEPRGWLVGHSEPVMSLAASGGKLVSGSRDGTIRIWDAARAPQTPRGHKGPATAVAFAARGLLTGGLDGEAMLWTTRDVPDLRGNLGGGQIWDLCAMSPPPLLAAAATQSGRVAIINERGEVALLDRLHEDEVRALCRLPDGRLVSGDASGGLVLWVRNWRGGYRGRSLGSLQDFSIMRMAVIAPSVVAVATGFGSVRQTIVCVDVDRNISWSLAGHEGPVYAVASGPRGTLLSGSADGTARIWNWATKEQMHVYDGHPGDVGGVGALSDSLVVSAGGGELHVWGAWTGQLHAQVAFSQLIEHIAVDTSGGRVAIVHTGGGVIVMRVPSALLGTVS